MWARPRRNDDHVADPDDAPSGHGDGWRSVDDGKAHPAVLKLLEVERQAGKVGRREQRCIGLALVPPRGETALRVGVDEGNRADAGALRLHREMAGERRLARAPFLRREGDHTHR